ncbi:hypothetical protein KXD40_009211 [Peronospora effusa]|nr:hypothetical protein KXD40_009211 [Peronospora effusa]
MGLSQILQHTSSVLTPEDRAYLDSPLTANDFDWALQHTAPGKTPGPDGLPLDYYKMILLVFCMTYDTQRISLDSSINFTVVLPFRPWSAATAPLRLELEQLGVEVVGNSGRTKLLGIYYGPQLSNADRLQHLLAEMQARCFLWTHRSRTLRGQFSASVCHVPATGFQDQVSTLISRFLCKSKSNIALPKDWWFLPPGLGGLGLTPVSDMIHSLQVHMLCKVILAARTHSIAGVPSWVEPVIRLFDQAISPWGQDFDILYAPVSTSPDYAKSHRWAQLEDYWHSVLFVWNTRLRKKLARRQSSFDKLSIPILNNEQELFRPSDLYQVCGSTVTCETLSVFLRTLQHCRSTGASACSNLLARLHCFLGPLKVFPIGPAPTTRYFCAFHDWVFDDTTLEELIVSRIRSIIVKCTNPVLPLSRLGLDEGPPPTM